MNKVYSFLSLIARSGKLISGGKMVEKGLTIDKIYLVIVADDTSSKIKERIIGKCNFRGVKIMTFGKKCLLGKYMGKEERSIVGIIDVNFACKMIELINEYNNQSGGEAIG